MTRAFRAGVALVAGATCGLILGQQPTGTISGSVADESGAVMPGVSVHITNKETGVRREATTSSVGTYTTAALQPGRYEVRCEATGFRTMVREATVETGSTTTVDLQMQVGAAAEVVQVESAAAQIAYDSHKIDGVITRKQIEDLPLNGRSFLQLAFLEPGVTVGTQSTAQYNAQFGVSVLGGDSSRTNISVDGGNVRNPIEGQTGMNFSQEVVQEFQLSSVNFDLSTGITSVGSVNVVTRTGGNDYHGSAYLFYRDHNMAAFPALARSALNPDPFFARRQAGFWLGGPIKKDKLFFFFNIENNNQDSVVTFQPNAASLLAFTNISPSPYSGRQHSTRFDYRITENHTLFARYSHDGNKGNGPRGGASMPSNWLKNTNWADQSLVGVTSTFRSSLVNDLRLNYWYWRNRNLFPSEQDCPGCVGLGFPETTVFGTNFLVGNTQNATQGRDLRRYFINDIMTWQKGSHRFKFGGEMELAPGTGFWGFCDPACVTVYSPEIVRFFNSQVPAVAQIPIPATFRTGQDLLALPVAGWAAGIGDPSQPPPYNLSKAKQNNRYRLFWQDSWRVKPRFTLNYGVAWQAETTLANHDLNKPRFLEGLLGGGDALEPTKRDWNNFSPSLGFAWNPGKDNKTVIRGGTGIYYDTQLLWQRLQERGSIGPRGNGRVPAPGALVQNPIPGIPGVPVGMPLEFAGVPTRFTLGHLMSILPAARAGLERGLVSSNPNDLSVRNIDIFKSGTNLMPRDYPAMYGEHFNLGMQRELKHGLVLQADFVFRQFMNERFEADWNRWNDVRGPAIRPCRGAEAANPAVVCSTGTITFNTPSGRRNYKGLLVKLDRRFSNKHMYTVSYAFQSQHGFNGIINKRDWFASWGPQGGRHVLNVSGIVELPWKFQLSMISAMSSRGGVTASIPGIDLDGDGSGSEPLPGARVNSLNRGLGKDDLAKLVGEFNSKYAGTRTPRNQTVPRINLPSNYHLGDWFSSQDLRLSKVFTFGSAERYKFTAFAEGFNIFNVANLGGFQMNLTDATFGQPTTRAGQVFGSGGRGPSRSVAG